MQPGNLVLEEVDQLRLFPVTRYRIQSVPDRLIGLAREFASESEECPEVIL
jgi:hypothetical protein